jgi:CheY-like chemotaxis protein
MIPRKRVLVIDDDKEICELLEAILERTYIVTVAEDGNAGVASALADPPSLILCDVLMPKVDGAAVFEQIQSNNATRHIPVVLMSASGEPTGLPETARPAGFLQKPFQAAEVHALIANAITRAP